MIGSTEGENPPPFDVILSAIAHEQRRAVLHALAHTDKTRLEVSTLADRVSERVRNGELSDTEHRQRIHTALHHIHLPKLDSCGMIAYDVETKQVQNTTGELAQELLALIAPSDSLE